MWASHIMKYYSDWGHNMVEHVLSMFRALSGFIPGKNNGRPVPSTWMNPENSILSKRSSHQNHILCDFVHRRICRVRAW